MKPSSMSAAGSIFTAIVASLCCIGPAVLALLGAGAVGISAAIEIYRPYFITLSVALLFLSFYFTYHKKKVVCEDGGCEVVMAGRWNKISLLTSSIIVLTAILIPYINLSPTAGTAAISHPGTGHKYAMVVLSIKGMDCEACANGLQVSLSKIKGVKLVHVNYKLESAVIDYDSMQVSPTALTDFLARAGYKATAIKTNKGGRAKAPTNAACPSCF